MKVFSKRDKEGRQKNRERNRQKNRQQEHSVTPVGQQSSSTALLDWLPDGKLEDADWQKIEARLLSGDLGVSLVSDILAQVRPLATTADEAASLLRQTLLDIVNGKNPQNLSDPSVVPARELLMAGSPAVWLIVGVNGVGKTTTVGKLANWQSSLGRNVVLAAADTFRAAATEQLSMWAQKVNVPLVKGSEGGDPASVIYDAVEHAAAKGADLVIADTAGRIHTKTSLMDEISKVRRVADKSKGTVCEVLLVLDATGGQNGISQAKVFSEAVDVTGIVLTKLDSAAKGGVVVSAQRELSLPVKLVGTGESAKDLAEFQPEIFVDGLLQG